MINKIKIANYKAFKEAEIDIRPITILLGVNSVGKTSILNLPMLMAQQNYEVNENSLQLNGSMVNFGEPINVVHQKNIDNVVSIGWDITLSGMYDRDRLKDLYFDFNNKLRSYYDRISNTIRRVENNGKLSSFIDNQLNKKFDFDSSGEEYIRELKALKLKLTRSSDKQRTLNEFSKHEELKDFFTKPFTAKQLEDTLHYLRNLNRLPFNKTTITRTFKVEDDKLMLCGESIISDDKVLISYEFVTSNRGRNHRVFKSDLISSEVLSNYSGKLSKYIFDSADDHFPYYYFSIDFFESFSSIIKSIFKFSNYTLERNFNDSRIFRVGPLRAAPKRYYFIESDHGRTSTFSLEDGDRLLKMIKEDQTLKSRVNGWLKEFGFETDVTRLRDIIHSFKIHQHGLDLDISDVGFGLSQVLPVLVQGFSSYQGSLTIIEQPEIHLHPRMQSSLADLFISMVNGQKKNFLIETHSEHLLRRLRRRIVEGEIEKENVRIYFLRESENGSQIEEIKFDEKGGFEFPSEFLEDEINDNVAYLKAYSK